MNKTSIIMVMIWVFAALIPGCGGLLNSVHLHTHKTVTTGRELVDLQEARDKKAISEDEYNKMKTKMVKSELDENK